MEKVNKQTEIKKLLVEGQTVKEVSELINTNIAYVYKLNRELKNSKSNAIKNENQQNTPN